MKAKLFHIFIVVAVLVLVSLACQTIMGGLTEQEAPEEIAPAPEQAEPPQAESSDEASDEVPAEAPQKAPDLQLGEEFRSSEGGFSFNAIPGYKSEEFIGLVSLVAPDSDQVSLILVGGIDEDGVDLDGLYQNSIDGLEDEGIELSERRDVTVDGIPGYAVDLHGFDEDVEMAGRIVVVVVSPTQEFNMMASAPAERWASELDAYFDAVLATVLFFEPVEIELTFEEDEATDSDDIRQWASAATASSEYSSPSWAAMQATGEPDTLIDYCGTMDTAWASYEGYTVEWIELSYDQAVIPTEINIIQTSAPNQVVQVDVIGMDGSYETVYKGVPEKIIEGCPYILTVYPGVDYEVNGVKITIDQTELKYPWNEVDAVELVGYPEGDGGEVTSVDVELEVGTVEGVLWRFGGEEGYEDGQYGGMDGVDATSDGLVYVTDSELGVRVLNASDGSEVMTFGADTLWSPDDLTIAPNGNIYVSEWGDNMIFGFSPDGELLLEFGGEGNGAGEFGTFSPNSIAISLDGEIYALDENEDEAGESFTRIQIFSADGDYLREFPISEDPEIEAIEFGPDGNLYMVDWFGDVILKFSPDGELLGEIGGDALYFASPQDLDIDDSGNFYVAVWSPDSVMKLDPAGNLVAQFGVEADDGEKPWSEGAFYAIDGVAVLPDGSRVFATDSSGYYTYLTVFEFR